MVDRAMNDGTGEPLVVTDRRRAVLQRSLAVTIAVISFAIAAGSAPDLGAQLSFLAIGLAASIALIRVANARVVADDFGLILKKPLRSIRISWPEVEGFALREPRSSADAPQPVVELRDGNALPLPGLDAPFALVRSPDVGIQVAAVASLNDRLEEWRGASAR
jgi:hypothetical protein